MNFLLKFREYYSSDSIKELKMFLRIMFFFFIIIVIVWGLLYLIEYGEREPFIMQFVIITFGILLGGLLVENTFESFIKNTLDLWHVYINNKLSSWSLFFNYVFSFIYIYFSVVHIIFLFSKNLIKVLLNIGNFWLFYENIIEWYKSWQNRLNILLFTEVNILQYLILFYYWKKIQDVLFSNNKIKNNKIYYKLLVDNIKIISKNKLDSSFIFNIYNKL